jgi:predicted secreted protein
MAAKMIYRLTGLLLAGLLLLPPAMMAAEPTTVTVTKEKDGREAALKVGDILQVELPGKAGTGYSWSAVAAGAPYLKLISQDSRPVAGQPPLGGPVVQVWRFRAEKPGTALIKMSYYRPWEGVGKAVGHFSLKIRIE